MQITTTRTAVVATAETMEDTVRLLQLVAPAAPEKVKRFYKKSAWKGKHRVPCDLCSKKFKNLKLHMLKKHS